MGLSFCGEVLQSVSSKDLPTDSDIKMGDFGVTDFRFLPIFGDYSLGQEFYLLSGLFDLYRFV